MVGADGIKNCEKILENGCTTSKPLLVTNERCYDCFATIAIALREDLNTQCEEVCSERETLDIHCGGENPRYNKCVLKAEYWPIWRPLMQCSGTPVTCPTASANRQVAAYNPYTREKYTSASEACHALCDNTFFHTYCYHCDWSADVYTKESECENRCDNRSWDKTDCQYHYSSWKDCSMADGTCQGTNIKCRCYIK